MANPCFCGCSLKTACLIIATINMIKSALLWFVTSVSGGVMIGKIELDAIKAVKYKVLLLVGAGVGTCIVISIVFVLLYYLALTLKRGAEQEDLRMCRIWFNVTAILFVLGILGIIKMIALGFVDLPLLNSFTQFFFLDNEVYIFGCLAGFGLVYNGFSLWVVYEFMNTLKTAQVLDTVAAYNVGGTGNAV